MQWHFLILPDEGRRDTPRHKLNFGSTVEWAAGVRGMTGDGEKKHILFSVPTPHEADSFYLMFTRACKVSGLHSVFREEGPGSKGLLCPGSYDQEMAEGRECWSAGWSSEAGIMTSDTALKSDTLLPALPLLSTNQLSSSEQVTYCLWASVSSSAKWEWCLPQWGYTRQK